MFLIPCIQGSPECSRKINNLCWRGARRWFVPRVPEQIERKGIRVNAILRAAIERARYLAERPNERSSPQAVVGAKWRMLWVAAAAVLGLIVWVKVIALSVQQTPGLEGWLNGIFGGLFGGLSTVLIVLLPGYVMWPFFKEAQQDGVTGAAPDGESGEADAELEQTLVELEAVRQQARSQVPTPSPKFAFIGALAGFLWFIIGGASFSVVGLLLSIAFGAAAGVLIGYGPAAAKLFRLDAIYGNLYLQRVLPKLLSGFGQLGWRRPAQPPLDEFRRYRLFPQWNSVYAGDEIHGDYRGLPLSISELNLISSEGGSHSVFRGLVVALALPRGLRGITVVTSYQGVFAHFAERWRENAVQSSPLQSVHLEDPEFAKAYQVHATDQISSRALLTPAFMERFKALAERLGAPALLVEDNRLILALATDSRNFFQPPIYGEPATARARLTQLREDIATLLRTADAVIDLDQSTRGQPL